MYKKRCRCVDRHAAEASATAAEQRLELMLMQIAGVLCILYYRSAGSNKKKQLIELRGCYLIKFAKERDAQFFFCRLALQINDIQKNY